MTIRTHLCRTCETALQNTVQAVRHEQDGHKIDTVTLHYRTRGKGPHADWQWSSDWQRAGVPTLRVIS